MKRVGIYQNTLTSGGRIKVITAMTYVSNKIGKRNIPFPYFNDKRIFVEKYV